jgi:GPH family glycoside/pentoside/hexuronide:cation symporter
VKSNAHYGADEPLRLRHYIGFGIGDFAFNLFFQGTALFLLLFYTDVLGIEASLAGTIFLVATIWDAVTDPVMGYLASRTQTRWGRYRPYLLIAALPLGFSYTFMFYQPSLDGIALFYWALLLQLLFRSCFTLGNIPYSSLSSEMTTQSHERSKLAAYRMFLGYAGALAVSYLTLSAMSRLGWDAASDGFFKVGFFFTALATLLLVITYRNTFEVQPSATARNYKLKELVNMLRQNKPFLLLCFYIMAGMAGVIFFYQSLGYFFKYHLQNGDALGTGMLFLFLALMATLPLWLRLSRTRGKRFTLLSGCLWLFFSSLAFYINPLAGSQLSWAYFHMASIGIGIGCAAFSFWAMLPDTVEYGEWKSGVRAEGVLFGLGLFSLKLGLGLGSFILGKLLGHIGYQANILQSHDTLHALHLQTTLSVGIMALCIFLIMVAYPLTTEKHQKIVAELS